MKKILLPVDGSERSNKGVEKANELATFYESEIILLYVEDTSAKDGPVIAPNQVYDSMLPGISNATGGTAPPVMVNDDPNTAEPSDDAKKVLSNAQSKLKIPDTKLTTLSLFGDPADVIIHYAKHSDIDLVIMGSSAKSGLKHFFIGSVAEKVAKSIEQSILIIR